MVFYRKYRPQKIEELDSQEIRDTLHTVFSGKSIAHAFLFTGPKGLGKTSAARIIAKILNCEKINDYSSKRGKPKKKTLKTKTIEPCNKCDQCISITNGSNIDVLEIDGASNRGIDEIRDLREKIKLSPARALKKVYIIDEVHMLTTEAFNALLKTLEEPPSHALFILCTTEQHKVPGTIASRCFRIAFKRASKEELVRSFKRIASEEKINVDSEVLLSIARLSDGSFRDGVKVLEELMAVAGGRKITKEILESRYQVLSVEKRVLDLLRLMEDKSTQKALELIGRLTKEGIEVRYFLEQLINKLHEELLIKTGVFKQEPQVNLDTNEIIKLIEALVKANLEIKFALLAQLPLEITIVQWCSSKKKEIKDTKEEPKSEIVEGDFWKNLIEKINPHNHSAAGLLRGCTLINLADGKMTIETAYEFHKDKLDELRTKHLIEKVAEELTGNKLQLETILKEKRG